MAFPEYSKRSIGILFLALIFGAATGVVFGELLGLLLPEGVVKQFFLQSVSWGLSPATLDFLVLSVTIGFRVKFNISSVLGLVAVYYFLRYFR